MNERIDRGPLLGGSEADAADKDVDEQVQPDEVARAEDQVPGRRTQLHARVLSRGRDGAAGPGKRSLAVDQFRLTALLSELTERLQLAATPAVKIDDEARAATEAHGASGLFAGGEVLLHPDRFDPDSARGRYLLAHELAHAAQRRLARAQHADGSQPDPALAEDEAHRIGEAFAAGQAFERPMVPLHDTVAADTGKKTDADWLSPKTAVQLTQPRFARVLEVSPGLAVRKSPERFDDNRNLVEMLQFNDRVLVTHVLVYPSGWSYVVTDKGNAGYLWNEFLTNSTPPEPNARLHKIEGKQTAIGIAEKYYKGHVEWGQDYRFYVNVLVFTNGGVKNQDKGISIDEDNDSYSDWKKVETKENYYIWIPSVEFAKALKGQVNSGSLSYQAYQHVKDFVMDALEWLTFGIAYLGGLVVGILECVWDTLTAVVDLIEMVYDLLKNIFDGSIISDAEEMWKALTWENIKDAFDGWVADFDKKWNDPNPLKRGFFQGRTIGYIMAEVAIAILSAGTLAAVKWGGKMAKFGATAVKALKKIKPIGKAIDKAEDAAKTFKHADELADGMKKSGKLAPDPPKKVPDAPKKDLPEPPKDAKPKGDKKDKPKKDEKEKKPKKKSAGEELREALGYPEAPKGYYWAVLETDGKAMPVIKRSPRKGGSSKPRMRYNPLSQKFEYLSKQWSKCDYHELAKMEPCFPPGTPVATPSGTRPIESLAPGDRVLSFDATAGAVVEREVTAVVENHAERLAHVHAGGAVFPATRMHRFFANGAWTPARRLWAGMALRALDGSALVVDDVRVEDVTTPTYNLEVAGTHNYFVGDRAALVHNGKGDDSVFASMVAKDQTIYGIWDDDLQKYIYVGKSDDEVRRFSEHLRDKPAWKERERFLSTKVLEKGTWTPYETAVWEKHYIEKHKLENPKLENDGNPIGKNKFDKFKDLHNPCK